MTIKEQIDHDLKAALLGGDKTLATTLRGLKGAILNAEIAANARTTGLPEPEVISLMQKEAKKRQESIDMYRQGGRPEKAEAEQAEKEVIAAYLPKQLTEDELQEVIGAQIKVLEAQGMQDMGRVIGAVKTQVGGSADGAMVARLVKERLTQ